MGKITFDSIIKKLGLIGLLTIFASSGLMAQSDTPCEGAQRWTDGAGWVNGTINESPGNNDTKGIVACGSAANTQSQVAPFNNSVYNSSSFLVDVSGLNCIDPSTGLVVNPVNPTNGEPIIWLNFDVRANGGSFQIQINDNSGDNVAWALYSSNTSTNGTSTAANGEELSGDCSSLTLRSCGVESSNTWNTLPVPDFNATTNYYMAIWDQDADGDVQVNNFKARFGCGDADVLICNLAEGTPTTSCNDDGTYTVSVPIEGINGEFYAYDPNATPTLSTSVCLTNSSDTNVTSGTLELTYPQGVDYNITIFEATSSSPPIAVPNGACPDPDGTLGGADECTVNVSGTAPICFICPTLNNESPDMEVCVDNQEQTLSVDTDVDDIDIEFVWFNAAQANPYGGGTPIGTAVTPVGGTATSNAGINFATSGTYYVYAILDTDDPELTDSNCRPFTEIIITVVPLPDQPTVNVTDATCDTAGTATITNYDATLTYTFAPNDGTTVGAGGVISGFVPGTDYTVTASSEAQNGDDCSSQPVDFNVAPATDAPDQPVVQVTDATCDAAGTATITNYDATLTYTFAPNDGTTVGPGGVISGFVPGTDYTVTASSEAQNGDDCSSLPVDFYVAPATDAPDQPVVQVTDATCDTAGTATITNYDAALTYTFAPNDGTTVGAGGVISGFVPGTDYTVTASSEAQNGDDCSSQPVDFGIIEPTPPNAGDDNEITVCDGASVDLTSLVTESDGTFSEAMISGGLDGDSFDTTGLSPGSYEIIYTVEAGQLCPADTATITIHVAEPVDAGADNTISVCEGTVVDLSELVTVPGGTFSATNGGSVNGNEFDTSGLSPGDYSIEYTVDGGDFCPDDTALITVSVAEDIIVQTCEAVDATSCNDGTTRFNFYWFGSNASPGGSNAFGSNATNNLSFTEFNDGTALIQGTTVLGSCTAALYIKLVGKTDWAGWQLEGGTFKKMGCTNPDPTMLHYYVIDNTVSTITTTGGDCLEEGTFIVSQKPDPNDPLTPHLGVVMGPGGVLHGVDPTATGIAGWGFMGPENDPKKYDIDFNFELDCEDATGCEIKVEICDGIDNDGDGQIDEGFDSDGDGIADCEDVEECDGIDNDGDLLVDEGFDSDMDGTADCFDEEICDGLDNDGDGEIDEGLSCGDIEVCDGVDNDGDGEIDEGFDDTDNDGIADCVDPCDNRFDSDGDNIPDCEDVEECDGLDNDGDGMVDEGFADTDNDGTADCQDVEECDGVDNDGDGEIDEGFDSDGDGTPDCQDVEECDGLDNDGDGTIDEGFADTDGDGIADCIDVEECDGKDNDGDGEIDEGFDSDGDGTPDCRDIEECDGVDNDGDGEIDEDLDCTEVCDGIDNDGDGEIDEGFDSDGDGTPDCEDTEECDGVDNDGDGEIDEGFDSDGDGTADCEDTEECDGVDNDGDGEIDEGFDSDGDGTPDCEDTEECDGVDNDGDGEIDEGFDSDGDGTADCEDTEECDGVDNDGDGEIDEGFDSDGDGTPDCEDTEECDGVDNDGDGEIDEDLNCDDAPEGCETAFARLETNNTCFLDDGFNRWGWTNQLTTEGNYTMDLYSGAGQCDLTKGEKSGTVEVEYSNGSVTVSIELSPGFVMTEAQLYVGGAPYPVKGNNPTVAPGQYPVKEEGLDKVTRLDFDPIDVSHITGDLYIIVHAVTCEVETDDSTAKTEVQAFPMTFKNELNLRVEIPYDSNLTVEMFDVNGRCVLEKGGMSLKTGKNDIRLNLSNMAPDVYILILNTERERIIKKVMSRK
ncbi:MAG: hypothetical protein Mars2KO_02620 [Maribacter sp.]